VREQSATRRELEASIRALLPSKEEIDEMTPSKNSTASAGVGGIMTGYVWGRYRGRQVRKAREVILRAFSVATASALRESMGEEVQEWLGHSPGCSYCSIPRLARRAQTGHS
jgi:hypothetical protein